VLVATSFGAHFPAPMSQIIFPKSAAASVQLYHNDFPGSCQRTTLPSPVHSAFSCVTCGSCSSPPSTANTHEQQHSSVSANTTQNTRRIIVKTLVVKKLGFDLQEHEKASRERQQLHHTQPPHGNKWQRQRTPRDK
ncbi:hypothetical protein TcG_10831, partial [Trypanosoma cruzi]